MILCLFSDYFRDPRALCIRGVVRHTCLLLVRPADRITTSSTEFCDSICCRLLQQVAGVLVVDAAPHLSDLRSLRPDDVYAVSAVMRIHLQSR